MKKALYLWIAVLAVCGLTTTAFADAIAEPSATISGRAGLWLLILLIALVFVTLYIASKHGGKRK